MSRVARSSTGRGPAPAAERGGALPLAVDRGLRSGGSDPPPACRGLRWRGGGGGRGAAQGFTGGYDIVRRWAARRRVGAPVRPPSARIPSTRRITRCLDGDPAGLSPEDRAFTEAPCRAAPRLGSAAEAVRAFAQLLRKGDPAGLTPWLEAAAATGLGGFVVGLRQNEAAVCAAIVERWSNDPVEGQVNCPKPIKRSMYGRAKFDLLRQRVLRAAWAETAWAGATSDAPAPNLRMNQSCTPKHKLERPDRFADLLKAFVMEHA